MPALLTSSTSPDGVRYTSWAANCPISKNDELYGERDKYVNEENRLGKEEQGILPMVQQLFDAVTRKELALGRVALDGFGA